MLIYLETLGCKVNQFESLAILDDFLAQGFTKTENMTEADVIVLNTCTVTNRTDYKSRYLIKQAKLAKMQKKNCLIVVTGCYSQRYHEIIAAWGFVDLVIDNNHKHQIVHYVKEQLVHFPFQKADSFTIFQNLPINSSLEKSRPFLKIQDGCNGECTYCAVPFARGKSRSGNISQIINQAEKYLDLGYQEIVLGGVNLGLFNSNNHDLSDLIEKLAALQKLKRIRLSSLEPQLWTDKLLNTIQKQPKICNHFHIPLQTGCDALLRLHQRKYQVQTITKLVEKLHQLRPFLALGFDVIAGLPGETDDLFHESYNFLQKLNFTYLHVFIYSPRPQTIAAQMENQVHGQLAKIRSKKLLQLSKEKKKIYLQNLVLNHVPLQAEKESFHQQLQLWSGTSDHYVKIYFQKQTTNLIPTKIFQDGLYAETPIS